MGAEQCFDALEFCDFLGIFPDFDNILHGKREKKFTIFLALCCCPLGLHQTYLRREVLNRRTIIYFLLFIVFPVFTLGLSVVVGLVLLVRDLIMVNSLVDDANKDFPWEKPIPIKKEKKEIEKVDAVFGDDEED